jgi:hypothetical protein
MREPRARQRFPGNGKQLWELLRMDYEPFAITIYPIGEISKARAEHRDTLTYEPEFDPMLYFWPVENLWSIVFMKAEPHQDTMKRMAKALERDGSPAVTFIWSRPRTELERAEFGRDWLTISEVRNFGKGIDRAGPVASPV